jgi:hypothetical protein
MAVLIADYFFVCWSYLNLAPELQKITSNKIKQNNVVGFDVLTAVPMKSTLFWLVTLCSSERVGRFGATFHLHLQAGKQQKQANKLSAGFLLDFLFDSEVGEGMFLRNVDLSPNYVALQLKRPCSIK